MGLKLPKSLLRTLFPSRKKKRRKKAAGQSAADAANDGKYYEPQRDDGSPPPSPVKPPAPRPDAPSDCSDEVRGHNAHPGKGRGLQLVIDGDGGDEGRSGTPRTVTSVGSESHVSLLGFDDASEEDGRAGPPARGGEGPGGEDAADPEADGPGPGDCATTQPSQPEAVAASDGAPAPTTEEAGPDDVPPESPEEECGPGERAAAADGSVGDDESYDCAPTSDPIEEASQAEEGSTAASPVEAEEARDEAPADAGEGPEAESARDDIQVPGTGLASPRAAEGEDREDEPTTPTTAEEEETEPAAREESQAEDDTLGPEAEDIPGLEAETSQPSPRAATAEDQENEGQAEAGAPEPEAGEAPEPEGDGDGVPDLGNLPTLDASPAGEDAAPAADASDVAGLGLLGMLLGGPAPGAVAGARKRRPGGGGGQPGPGDDSSVPSIEGSDDGESSLHEAGDGTSPSPVDEEEAEDEGDGSPAEPEADEYRAETDATEPEAEDEVETPDKSKEATQTPEPEAEPAATAEEGDDAPGTPTPDQAEEETPETDQAEDTQTPEPEAGAAGGTAPSVPDDTYGQFLDFAAESSEDETAEAGTGAAAAPRETADEEEAVLTQEGASDESEAKSDEREAVQADEDKAPSSHGAFERVRFPPRRADVADDDDSVSRASVVSRVSSRASSRLAHPVRITNEWERRRVPRAEEVERLVMAEASEGESDASVNGAAVDILRGRGDPLDTVVEIEDARRTAGGGNAAAPAPDGDVSGQADVADYLLNAFDSSKKAGGTADEDKENCQASAPAPPAARKKAVTFQFSRHGEEARLRAIARSRKILSQASLRLESIDTTSTDLVNSVPEEGSCYHSRYAPRRGGGVPSPSHPSRALAAQRRFNSGDNLDASASGGRSVLTVESRETRDGSGSMASILFYEKGHRPAAAARRMDPLDEGEGGPGANNETAVSPLTPREAPPSPPAGAPASFFVLLLCPTSRIFELVEVDGDGDGGPSGCSAASTVGDVLRAASSKCTDDRLSEMEFVGLVRPSDRAEFASRDAGAFLPSGCGGEDEFIRQDDVLVAILESHTGSQMVRLSKAILKNERFRDMVRRRRRTGPAGSADDELDGSGASRRKSPGGHRGSGGSVRSVGSRSSRRSKSSRGMGRPNRPSRTPGASDDDSFFSAKSSSLRAKRPPSGRPRRGGKQPSRDDKYSSLCRRLEDLSRRLHEVDDEILGDDGEDSVAGGSVVSASASGAVDAGVDFLEKNKQELTTISESLMTRQTRKLGGKKFRMTTHMVAHELASNIEEIFADHDVEIVAVDAADDDDETTVCSSAGSEDGTFVSARSMRSARSLVSGYDQGDGLPTTLEFKPKVRTSRFDDDEDDMMAQIEAMAAEADLAFEKRRQGGRAASDSLAVEGKRPVTSDREEEAAGEERGDFPSDSEVGGANGALSPDDVLGTLRSTIRPGAEAATDITVTTTQRDALSRNFLNASTSMVSTMVAASEGRVNEVHVLQYLGVTMVCIAANFAQSVRGAAAAARRDAPPSGGSAGMCGKELMQSAMFLAFMVNGQRYLAKVTKK